MNKLSTVLNRVGIANGLPNDHYISDTTYAEEEKFLLKDSWAGVCYGKEIPKKGDAKPTNFMGNPLLIIRDQGNKIRVFQNTCRHRGMILIQEPSNIRGTIRCPYHSWCYSLDGALKSTPHVGGAGFNIHPDINRDELGLFEIRSYIFMDIVFVNISGKAKPFEFANKNLIDRWSEFQKPFFSNNTDCSFNLSINANWKLAVENFCESYHLPWIHPELNLVSKLADHFNIQKKLQFSGQGSKKYNQLKSDNGQKFTDFFGLSSKWKTSSEYLALYPNVLLGVHRDHVFSVILQSKDKNLTLEHASLSYAHPECLTPKFEYLRQKNLSFWETVFKEDIFVVEGMQKGRHGDRFDGGRFAPEMDSPTHCFHEWVATKVIKGRQMQNEVE